MVRGLGVSHKSLLVPDVAEGTYAIRYEHADYLTKDFNISVGAALPTTFSEAMTEVSYNMTIQLPAGTLLTNPTVIEGEDVLFNSFKIRNEGNLEVFGWYHIGLVDVGDVTSSIQPGTDVTITVPPQTIAVAPGGYSTILQVGPNLTGIFADNLSYTDSISETLTVTEWSTDITFIATAPGITDLHGVEVFIDGTSMGTT